MKLPGWIAARLHRRFGPSRSELQQDIDGLRAEITRLEVKLAERTPVEGCPGAGLLMAAGERRYIHAPFVPAEQTLVADVDEDQWMFRP